MTTFTFGGSFDHTETFLRRMKAQEMFRNLDRFGREGVAALANATPVDTGLTAASWTYEVSGGSSPGITFFNTHSVSGLNVAILIQYGHGTGTGGYVAGRDFINPVIRPLFDRIADDVWKAVTNG